MRPLLLRLILLPLRPGSNDHEFWGAAHSLGDQMDADTEESCTTYNVLKASLLRLLPLLALQRQRAYPPHPCSAGRAPPVHVDGQLDLLRLL